MKAFLFPVQLHDGVVSHAAARRLDHMGYTYDSSSLAPSSPEPANGPGFETVSGAVRVHSPPLLDQTGETFSTKLEQFIRAGRAPCAVGSIQTTHPVKFSSDTQMQKWMQEGFVDFVEIFRGHGELTIGVREAACTASEGFDKYAMTYGRCWCLETPRDQEDCAWLLVYALRPKVVHLGTPCTKMSVAGSRKIDSATEAQNEFTWKVAVHQQAEGLGVSIENPKKQLAQVPA